MALFTVSVMNGGYRIVALPKLPKLERGVRFPLPAPVRSVGIALVLSLSSSIAAQQVVFPGGAQSLPNWTEEERAAGVAVRHGTRNADLSSHYIFLAGSETPHFHDRHDLQVHLLRGAGFIHFREHSVPVTAGDVVLVPRGAYHWAESTGAEPMQVFATYSPAFDGRDRRDASQPPTD